MSRLSKDGLKIKISGTLEMMNSIYKTSLRLVTESVYRLAKIHVIEKHIDTISLNPKFALGLHEALTGG